MKCGRIFVSFKNFSIPSGMAAMIYKKGLCYMEGIMMSLYRLIPVVVVDCLMHFLIVISYK